MYRSILFTAAMVAAWCVCGQSKAGLIAQEDASRHGLHRPWFAQVAMDPSRARLRSLVLHDGILYTQTDSAIIHAFDAETGKTLWHRQVGDPRHPSTTTGVGHDRLAVTNGSRLFVLNRLTGETVMEKQVDGAPCAGPALSSKRAYVPLVNGVIIAYNLENPSLQPLFCQSSGRASVQPLIARENQSEEFVVWPTERGLLNVARADRHADDMLTLKYRLETGAEIVCQPAYLPDNEDDVGSGIIVAASRDGIVYAFAEQTGNRLWRFTAGESIIYAPAAIKDRIYVCTQMGGMYCLERNSGKSLWFAPKVHQFVAASAARVYAADRLGRLLVLDARSGELLDALDSETLPVKLANTQTDRIYLANEKGLIQCFHEPELTAPMVYAKARPKDKPANGHAEGKDVQPTEEKRPAKPKKTKPKPVDENGGEDDPFAGNDDASEQ